MKYREFWIEHKKFIDEWVYEAYQTNEERINKDLIPIHVIEYQAYEKLQKQNEKLKDALNYYTSPDLAHKLPYQAGFDYDEVIGEVARLTLKEIEESND